MDKGWRLSNILGLAASASNRVTHKFYVRETKSAVLKASCGIQVTCQKKRHGRRLLNFPDRRGRGKGRSYHLVDE